MKVILTEQQLNKIISIEKDKNLLFESFSNSDNVNIVKKKIKRAILAGVAIASILGAISKLSNDASEKKMLKQYALELQQDSILKAKQDSIFQVQKDSMHNLRVEACREYMGWALKNQGYTFKNTDLTPEAIVDTCEKNNFSIPFAMAILNWESCFGATPRAKKTNSVFSVGAYDNGNDICVYSHPNESIQPFIDLIKEHYLINGKTDVTQLLEPGEFVNEIGNRYSSNVNYEYEIKRKMNSIIRKYPVLA